MITLPDRSCRGGGTYCLPESPQGDLLHFAGQCGELSTIWLVLLGTARPFYLANSLRKYGEFRCSDSAAFVRLVS